MIEREKRGASKRKEVKGGGESTFNAFSIPHQQLQAKPRGSHTLVKFPAVLNHSTHTHMCTGVSGGRCSSGDKHITDMCVLLLTG